ncbi:MULTISPECIES: hypothetical protein [unclassified Bradyrhizobium]|uniref:hypothetical protein n=1 Tax=unclassified Bradyrhizobium TaxID=2631580 RepID=UPI0028E18E3D|nr:MULTISPECIES: hypothetical protein [unclassified Bradyrhizobium]
MTSSHQKSVGPAAVDAASGAEGRAQAPSRAGRPYSKKSVIEHQQKLALTFAPCREAHEEERRRDEKILKRARAVAVELGFEEVSPGRFEAMCPECEAFVGFGCDGVVEDNPRGSCKALPSIRAHVKSAFGRGGR